jgi:hypothetical protein
MCTSPPLQRVNKMDCVAFIIIISLFCCTDSLRSSYRIRPRFCVISQVQFMNVLTCGNTINNYLSVTRRNVSLKLAVVAKRCITLTNILQFNFDSHRPNAVSHPRLITYSCSCSRNTVCFLGATATIWAFAYLHETLRFTSVF